MSHLAPLRQKIKSVQTTKKITHAVRLVSMSLYNRLEKLNTPIQEHTLNLKNLFAELIALSPKWKSNLLFPHDFFDTKPLYIIVGTSKGLCGSLNSNLFRYLDSSIFIEKQQKLHFIAIGQRAIKYARDHDLKEIICVYPELTSNNLMSIASDLVNRIIINNHYSSVVFFSNEAKSFFIQKPKKFTLIPASLDFNTELSQKNTNFKDFEKNKGSNFTIWEQNQETILNHLSIRFIKSTIVSILFHALRAEHAARFMAMENSTNNAKQYLDRLTLQFNKLRQSLITSEVSELSASITAWH